MVCGFPAMLPWFLSKPTEVAAIGWLLGEAFCAFFSGVVRLEQLAMMLYMPNTCTYCSAPSIHSAIDQT
jgi:hypothetical protein